MIDNQPAEVREADDIASLKEQAKAEFALGSKASTDTIRSRQRLGAILCRVKAKVGHGNFEGWVRCYMEFSVRQAQRFMALYLDKPLEQKQRQGTIFDDEPKNDSLSLLQHERGFKILSGSDLAEKENCEDEGKSTPQKDPLKEFRAWWDKGIRWLDKVLADNQRNSPEAQDQRDKLTEVREWWEAMYRSQR